MNQRSTSPAKTLDRAKSAHPLFWLLIALSLKWLLGSIWQWGHSPPLAPDEAQYWTWSRDLSWGYYSKPPGIALQIRAGCDLLRSHTPFAVRALSGFFSWLSPLLLYRSGRAWGLSERASGRAALAWALCPAGILGQFAATTDVGLMLAWSGALAPLGRLHLASSPRGGNFARHLPELELGGWLALGLLFKWTMWFFVPLALACRGVRRRWWCHPSGFCLILASLALGMAPSLYWNAAHGGLTLRHVLGQVVGSPRASARGPSGLETFIGFVLGQFALLSPWLLLRFFRQFPWAHRSKTLRPLAGFAACTLALFAVISLWRRVQANWPLFAYPAIALCLGALEAEGKARLVRQIAYSAAFSVIALCIPHWQSMGAPLPLALNPLQQCMGWDRLSALLARAGWRPKADFLLTDTYQLTAELLYNLRSEETPGALRDEIVYFNLRGLRRNGFDERVPKRRWRRGNALYATVERGGDGARVERLAMQALARLAPFFSRVEHVQTDALVEVDGRPVRWLVICRGIDYNGRLPPLGTAH